ncbi:MAG: hypothetical protein ACR2ND_13665 [Solirubrobacteraceae bacterium]
MHHYSVAGLTLGSELMLPELPQAQGSISADWTFELTSEHPPGLWSTTGGHETQTSSGEVWRVLRLRGAHLLVAFPGSAEFVVLAAERRILCAASDGVADSLLRHLLLDQVIPYILAMQGWLVLHASGVATSDGAVAFVGPSGAGKSSLAASFAADGYALLSDDFLQLRKTVYGFEALPSYPGLRLWPDSHDFFADLGHTVGPVAQDTDKRRLAAGSARPPASLPLLAIIALADDDPEDELAFTLAPMARRDGFLTVFEHGFRLGQLERQRQLAEFNQYSNLASATQLLRLQYRWDFDLLGPIRSRILETVAFGSPR